MKRTLLLFLIISPLLSFSNTNSGAKNGAQALREQKKKMATPDIPGNFIVDFGFNLLTSKAPEMERKFWGSKSAALSYMFNINPPNTFFSLNTGITFGLEKYALEDDLILSTAVDDDLGRVAVVDTLGIDAKKSKIAANYIEIPFEIRVYTNQQEREKGMFFAIGASAGLLYQSFTKRKFVEDGVNSKEKINNDFRLNPFRARGIIRAGYRGFNFFYKFGITEWFRSGRGPSGAPSKMSTIGISFVGF